jgi:hypothetical protein
LRTGKRGVVEIDEQQRTSRGGVQVGDLSRGGATVILVMRERKIAASAIHDFLKERNLQSQKEGKVQIELV